VWTTPFDVVPTVSNARCMCSTSLSATTSKPDLMGVGGRIRAAALAARTLGLDMMIGMKCDGLWRLEVDVVVGRRCCGWVGVGCWVLAGDDWVHAGVLSKFLVVRVRTASSNLIWRHQFLEGLRSDATVTVTP
jgi:hypothetical protein